MTFDPRKDPSCVLFYQFAERSGNTVYDLSGKGNHGTIYGATRFGGFGRYGLHLDGVDDYVEATDSLSLRLTDAVTLIVLFNPRSITSDYAQLIGKGYDYRLLVRKSDRLVLFQLYDSTSTAHTLISTTTIKLNKLYTLAGTWSLDSKEMRIYINGEREPTTATMDSGIHISTKPFIVGAYNASTYLTNGDIYLACVYKNARSDEWIRRFYAWAMQGLKGKIPSRYIPRGVKL